MEVTDAMKKTGLLIILCALLVLVALNSFYTVEENQFACIVRFSEIISTTDTAGLHFKMPFVDSVKYFTKAKYLDLGHNETLSTIEFCKYMPNLEILIVSGSMVSDLTPLANCTKLEWLELTYCSYVTDITPLEGCVGLKCLNLGFTNVSDLTPVMDLELDRLHCILNQIPDEQEKAYDEAHPDTTTVWRGKQPYGYGWRYDDDGYTFCEYYKKVREVFDLDAVDQRLKAQEANKNKK